MNITIEAPFTVTDTARETIESKINDLVKFEPRMTQVNIYFKEDDGHIPNGILAEIILRVPGNDIFAESTDEDSMKAFTDTYNTIKRQLKKRKEKLNDHHSPVKNLRDVVNDNL